MFRNIDENKFQIAKLKKIGNTYDYSSYDIVLDNIPSKVVNGHLSIEYMYFHQFILPLFSQG